MEEIWKDVIGFEGLYQISNLGRVRSLDKFQKNHGKLQFRKGSIKSLRRTKQGYILCDLYISGKQKSIRVHKLVAEAFIENPLNKTTVNHIDGNKENNNVLNLEWATPKEQNQHFYKYNLKNKENIKKAISAMNKASSQKIICLNDGKIYSSIAEVARIFNVSDRWISKICKNDKKLNKKDSKGNYYKFKFYEE